MPHAFRTLITFAMLGLGASHAHAQWVNQPIPFTIPTMNVSQVDAINPTTAWVLAFDPFSSAFDLARTTDGRTWTAGLGSSLATAQQVPIFLEALDANTAWVTALDPSGGRLLKTTNGGASWTVQTTASQFSSPSSYPQYIHFFNASEGVAVGSPDGTAPGLEIYTTRNGGSSWTRASNIPAALPGELGAFNVTGATPSATVGTTVWVPTSKGRVYYSTDQGQTWRVSHTGLTDGITAISFTSATQGLAMTAGISSVTHRLQRTSDGGVSWTSVAFTGPLGGVALDNIPGTTGYVSVGAAVLNVGGSGTAYSVDDGASWTQLDLLNHTSLDLLSASEAWAGDFTGPRVHKLSTTVLGTRRAGPLPALAVYPNPSRDGLFTLALATALPAATDVRVTDALGREVYHRALDATTRSADLSLDLRAQRAGLYTLQVRSTAGVAQQKLLLQP